MCDRSRPPLCNDSPPPPVLLTKTNALPGGHVIKLGPGCEEPALAALRAWPGGLQIGGGITAENAAR